MGDFHPAPEGTARNILHCVETIRACLDAPAGTRAAGDSAARVRTLCAILYTLLRAETRSSVLEIQKAVTPLYAAKSSTKVRTSARLQIQATCDLIALLAGTPEPDRFQSVIFKSMISAPGFCEGPTNKAVLRYRESRKTPSEHRRPFIEVIRLTGEPHPL